MTANDTVQELLERARKLCRDQEEKKGELEESYRQSFDLARKNWTGGRETWGGGGGLVNELG